MSMPLSTEEIGKRLRRLRKKKGFSQDDIARILKIPRPSVVQMEKGNRNISLLEMNILSETLGFSIDNFLTASYEAPSEIAIVAEPEVESGIAAMRDSTPVLKKGKLETVLLHITTQCGAKPNMDVALLLNLLYFCDFNHYELHEEQLTGLLYTKQSFGPSPEQALKLIKEMEDEKKLLRYKSSYANVPHIKYLPGAQADLMRINAAEKEVIDLVIEQFSSWPASRLSTYAREDMPWKATELREPIDYELVFYRRPPYSVRFYEEDLL
jgi:transcriptional regulator with XRE-family HTH domain